jgi:hypothetical protein
MDKAIIANIIIAIDVIQISGCVATWNAIDEAILRHASGGI